MKGISRFMKLAAVLLTAGMGAQASILLDTASSVALSDPTQTGRLSRNGIAQDWSGSEVFPGVLNPSTPYYYKTFLLNVGVDSFIQISFDDLAGRALTFVSAYQNSYAPNSAATGNLGFDTNWLGDAGASGNAFGTDPRFFQVVVPANNRLIVAVNTTGGGTLGTGDAYRLIVEGFVDSNFDEAPVPEPGTAMMFTGGLAMLAFGWRRMRSSGEER